jgi:CRP-like cAMP-binding protein
MYQVRRLSVFNPPVLSNHLANRLLAALPADAIASLGPDLKQVSFDQGAVLLDRGNAIEQVYFPQTGMVSLLVVSGAGAMVETSMVGREGAVGLHRGRGQRRSFTRAIVQVPGRFSAIAASAFEAASLGSASIRGMIASYTEMLLAEAQQIAACNAVHDAAARLCRCLLQSADRIDADQLPLTQDYLAHMLGVRRTTVTLLAQDLQKKGAMRYSRGKISIVDRDLLERGACDCYSVIRHDKLPADIGLTLGNATWSAAFESTPALPR